MDCHSERSEESLLTRSHLVSVLIPRYARNDMLSPWLRRESEARNG